MNILVIDPWGINNTREYLYGLVSGLSRHENVTLMSNYYYSHPNNEKYKFIKTFFKISEDMKDSIFRKVIRGIEYIIGYIKILIFLRKNDIDIVHINWLLFYKLDNIFLKLIKRKNINIIYTAHNAVPHINPQNYLNDLDKIYDRVDKIIVHGNNVKQELISYFPKNENKIYIQLHGYTNLSFNKVINNNLRENINMDKINKYKNIFIFFGNIFYEKGTDRLVKFWMKNSPKDILLIIAGKKSTDYPELVEYEEEISHKDNILYFDEYVEDDLLNYMINKSKLVLLPYRHASMSGVIFTAAAHKKTVFTTAVGSIPEYVENEIDCFLVENSEEKINQKLKYVVDNIDNIDFDKMGESLHNNIKEKCNWELITTKLINEVYRNNEN